MNMRERIEEAIKHSKADYTEIRIEEKESTQVVYQGKDLEKLSALNDKGGLVRVLIRNKGWGVVTFNNLDELTTKVDQAYQCAMVASAPEPIELAQVEPVDKLISAQMKYDFRDMSLAAKKSLAERYNNILCATSQKIVDTYSAYSDNFSRVYFANSQGTFIEDERPTVSIVARATTRDGDNVQEAHEGHAGPF